MKTSRAALAEALRRMAPRLPPHEFEAVLDHARASPALRIASPENAAWLALAAYTRHVFTEYDALRDQGYDRDSARHFVAEDMDALLAGWGVPAALRSRLHEADEG